MAICDLSYAFISSRETCSSFFSVDSCFILLRLSAFAAQSFTASSSADNSSLSFAVVALKFCLNLGKSSIASVCVRFTMILISFNLFSVSFL